MDTACSAPGQKPIQTIWPAPTMWPAPRLLLRVCAACPGVVVVTGELDLSTRGQLISAATAERHPAMVIDLAGCTFMDCSGYGSLVASRVAIEHDGRSLTITGINGQPARLWKLIADLEPPPTTMPSVVPPLPC